MSSFHCPATRGLVIDRTRSRSMRTPLRRSASPSSRRAGPSSSRSSWRVTARHEGRSSRSRCRTPRSSRGWSSKRLEQGPLRRHLADRGFSDLVDACRSGGPGGEGSHGTDPVGVDGVPGLGDVPSCALARRCAVRARASCRVPRGPLGTADDRPCHCHGIRHRGHTSLLRRDEHRCVGEREGRPLDAHAAGSSSVVSGRSTASCRAKPGSARQWPASAMKASHGVDRGRAGSGTSSATGRPLTVTRRCSPASTRRSTELTSFRRSRAGMSAIGSM